MNDTFLAFALACSIRSLEEYELSRLNHAALIRKELRALLDALVDEEVAADKARWLLENRDKLGIELPPTSDPFATVVGSVSTGVASEAKALSSPDVGVGDGKLVAGHTVRS